MNLSARQLRTLRAAPASSAFIIDSASDTLEALSLMLDRPYSLVVLGESLSDRTPAEAVGQLRRMRPGVRALLLARTRAAVRRPTDDSVVVLHGPFTRSRFSAAVLTALA